MNANLATEQPRQRTAMAPGPDSGLHVQPGDTLNYIVTGLDGAHLLGAKVEAHRDRLQVAQDASDALVVAEPVCSWTLDGTAREASLWTNLFAGQMAYPPDHSLLERWSAAQGPETETLWEPGLVTLVLGAPGANRACLTIDAETGIVLQAVGYAPDGSCVIALLVDHILANA